MHTLSHSYVKGSINSVTQHIAAATSDDATAICANAASSSCIHMDVSRMSNPSAGANSDSSKGKQDESESVIPFPFPFPPYPQQYALMKTIFDCIELGKGHVCIVESPTGTGKCWGTDTELITFQGRSITVQEIVKRMNRGKIIELMGDDGTVRRTIPGSQIIGNTAHNPSTAAMYRITSMNEGRLSWTCNNDHILVVKFNTQPTAVKEFRHDRSYPAQFYFDTLEVKSAVQLVADCTWQGGTVIHRTHSYSTHEDAEEARACALAHWKPFIWECTVDEFLNCSTRIQNLAQMYQPQEVQFHLKGKSLRERLLDALTAVHPDVPVSALHDVSIKATNETAWVIGMWLTADSKQKDSSHQPQSTHIHDSDIEIVKRLEDWYNLLMRQEDPVALSFHSTPGINNEHGQLVMQKISTAPNILNAIPMGPVLRHLLKAYEILEQKKFPHHLLCESKAVRMSLLAGIVDGSGCSYMDKRYIHVTFQKRRLIDGLIHLSRGLGFTASKVSETPNEEACELSIGYCVNISGPHLSNIQCALMCKRFPPNPSTLDMDTGCSGFMIEKLNCHANYYGFQIDGNGRCLLNDFVVTHNSMSLISSCLYWLLEHHPREEARKKAESTAALASSASIGGSSNPMSWVVEQHAAIQAAAQRKRENDAAILQATITKQIQKQAEQQRRTAAKTARAATVPDADVDADLLLTDVGATNVELTFPQRVELERLQEEQAQADALLHQLLTSAVPTKLKVEAVLERQARAARIATLTGTATVTSRSIGSSSVTSDSSSDVDELGSMLSRMLSGDRPRRKPQLIYASRTHSQLIQFVSELRKTKYGQRADIRPNVIPNNQTTSDTQQLTIHQRANVFDPALTAKVISLGSRAHLCNNPLVQHLKSSPLQLNDICVEMQKNPVEVDTPQSVSISIDKNRLPTRAQLTSAPCPFLDPAAVELFHSQALQGGIYDLEQLPALGVQMHFCSYYGSRNASPEADVIVLPYPSLLSAATRAALNIDLNEAIVVCDEAHNVHDVLNSLHSCVLPFSALERSLHALRLYRTKFEKRLKPDNLKMLNELIRLCQGFQIAFIRGNSAARSQQIREESNGAFRAGSGKEVTRVLDDFIGTAVGGMMEEPIQPVSKGDPSVPHVAKSSGLPPSLQRNLSAVSSSSSAAGSTWSCAPFRATYSLLKKPNAFAAAFLIENINPHVIAAWVNKQKLEQKIKGYLDRYPPEMTAAANAGEVIIHSKQHRSQDRVGAVADSEYESSSLSPLTPVMALITALNNADADGRIAIDIIVESSGSAQCHSRTTNVHPKSSLRFLHLNPSLPLIPVLKEARTLILAGGTMSPFDAFRTQIFPQLHASQPEKIHMKSFGHVVPKEHIQAIIVKAGPVPAIAGGGGAVGVEFKFTHALRSDTRQMDALADCLYQFLSVIPFGIVVFFPSYAMENEVIQYWSTHAVGGVRVYASMDQAALAGSSIDIATPSTIPLPASSTWMERLRSRKCIFREPRSANGVDQVLAHYTRIINEAESVDAGKSAPSVPTQTLNGGSGSPSNSPQRIPRTDAHGRNSGVPPATFTDISLRSGQTGALLFAIVGGKLSEGINFSDNLARAVIMIGLPYPNKHEASMVEKMKYLDQQEAKVKAMEKEKQKQIQQQAAAAVIPESSNTIEESKESSSMELNTSVSSPAAAPVLPPAGAPGSAGSRYVHTLCMRAVNQSIGRAIRHRNDYAAIILIDVRYTQQEVWKALPAWLTAQHQSDAPPSSMLFKDWKPFNTSGVTFREARMMASQFFAAHRRRMTTLLAESATNAAASAASNHNANSIVASMSVPSSFLSHSASIIPQKRKADDNDHTSTLQHRPSKQSGIGSTPLLSK
jgi:Rad3-related DNA helicase